MLDRQREVVRRRRRMVVVQGRRSQQGRLRPTRAVEAAGGRGCMAHGQEGAPCHWVVVERKERGGGQVGGVGEECGGGGGEGGGDRWGRPCRGLVLVQLLSQLIPAVHETNYLFFCYNTYCTFIQSFTHNIS
jgi:hypothetical protein